MNLKPPCDEFYLPVCSEKTSQFRFLRGRVSPKGKNFVKYVETYLKIPKTLKIIHELISPNSRYIIMVSENTLKITSENNL